MLNPQEAALESQAERIARIITREYGLTVKVEGSLAYYDFINNTIVIPALTKEELAKLGNVIDGFLDHESAHGIFTDVRVMKEKDLKPGTTLFNVWNPIEDFWIERAMGDRYLGCKQNIEKLNVALLKSLDSKWDKLDALTKLLICICKIWEGRNEIADFINEPTIGALLISLTPEIHEGFGVTSTSEACELAQKILDKIKQTANTTETQTTFKDQCSVGDEKGDSTEESTESAKSGEKGKEDKGISKGKEDGTEDSKASEGTETEGECTEKSEGGTETEPTSAEQAKGIQDQFDAGEDLGGDLDKEKFINDNLDNIRDRSTSRDPEVYRVYTEEFDKDVEFTLEERTNHTKTYKNLKAEIKDYLGNMSTMLSLALTAETEAYWVGGARRGRKWDRRKLPQWMLGGEDDRLWKQLEQGEKWDTAVTLLWDCSGSMGSNSSPGSKSALARLAAIAFHEALVRADIPHEVLGFDTGGDVPEELRAKIRQARNDGIDLDTYSRLDDTDNRYVFVPFGETDGRALCEINGGSANRDGECVLWAAKRLAKRTEKRKILIVGSDGQPSGARYNYTEKKYLQTVVRTIINSGIEVLALGIMNPSVKKYYPNWALVNEAADIPAVVMGELSEQLFKKGTCNVRFPELCRRSG